MAIQKEMFGEHFFLDKMVRIDVESLSPEQLVEAYKRRFKAAGPFTDETLLTLARMSHGVFRRFFRYIALTLDLKEQCETPDSC